MPDMIVQHIDVRLLERIKAQARDRQCSVNEVMLEALRNGLGMSASQQHSETLRDPSLNLRDGEWEAAEHGAFQEAVRALAKTSPTQLSPDSIRAGEAETDAE